MKFIKMIGALFFCSFLNQAFSADKIEMNEYMVQSDTPGISLYVRNKHLAGVKKFTAEKTLLYVHGSTYPSETAFDLSLGGVSWMEYMAARGYDVWLVDLRGYGKSTRPAEMDQPADQNLPLVRTDVAGQRCFKCGGLHLKKTQY